MIGSRLSAAMVAWLLVTGAPGSALAHGQDRPGTLEAILETPCERWSDVPVLQDRILALGPTALPELFMTWARGAVPATGAALDRKQELAVMGALERLPRSRLVSHLAGIADGRGAGADRHAALRLLRRIATISDLSLCIRLADAPEGADARLLDTFEECLARLSRRDPHATRAIGELFGWAPPRLLERAVRVIAARGDSEALSVLTACIGAEPALDPLLLIEIRHLVRGGIPPQEHHLEVFRSGLFLRTPAAVELSVLLVSDVHDSLAVPLLIDLLGADRIGERAQEALCRILGVNLPPEVEPWLQWQESEHRWQANEAPHLFRVLESDDATAMADAIRELAGHPLFADDIARAMAPLLAESGPRIAALACSALGQLRARPAIPDLVDCLGHEDEQVRRTACAALQRITGLELPPEPMSWRRSLDLPLEPQ